MTFTYDETLSTDLATIRYYLGDTVEAEAFFSDETITAVLGMEDTVGKATISLLNSMIGKIAREPDTRADWLSINYDGSLENLKAYRRELEQKFAVGVRVRGRVVYPRLTHSRQTDPPDYE